MDIERVDWIRAGTINALAYPRAGAAEYGVPVAVAANNLLMTGGSDSLAEMVATTERALLLTTLWYLRVVDPGVLLLTGLTRDGVYLVEDGRVTGAVNNFRFNETRSICCAESAKRAPATSRCRANGGTGPPGRRCRRCGSPTSTCRRSARRNNATMHDPLNGLLGRLVALAPPEHARITSLVRHTCATTLSLPRLPVEAEVDGPADEAESVAVEFAEQFSVDASSIGDDLRARYTSALGAAVFPAVMLTYFADFLPRVRSGFDALGLPAPWNEVIVWDHDSDLGDVLFNTFQPGVAQLRELDPLTTEIVRLRGATQHNCRLCKSRREGRALDTGGSESMYEQIERYETSDALSDWHKAALRYTDALIWTPANISADVASDVRSHFTGVECYELTLDVMRNAGNKIAVALGADTPTVEGGTERFLVDDNGQTVVTGS